jgi:SAM-dependent methyltransferase
VAMQLMANGDWRGLRLGCRRVLCRASIRLRGLDLAPVENLTELGLSPERSRGHGSSYGPELQEILKMLRIRPGDAIIDFGSGKGGALLAFAKFPFAKIAGVELSSKLIPIARENLARLGIQGVEIFHSDARAFTDLDASTHFYFFHPFPGQVLHAVRQNIKTSLESRPRDATVIYRHAIHRDVIDAEPLFQKAQECYIGSQLGVIYTHRPRGSKGQFFGQVGGALFV